LRKSYLRMTVKRIGLHANHYLTNLSWPTSLVPSHICWIKTTMFKSCSTRFSYRLSTYFASNPRLHMPHAFIVAHQNKLASFPKLSRHGRSKQWVGRDCPNRMHSQRHSMPIIDRTIRLFACKT
jgi:hypothetical protein